MHLEPVLVPLPIEQVNHLGRTGQALVHPEPDIEAFEEVGVDKGRQPVFASDLLVRVEAEVNGALERCSNQDGQCREILKANNFFYCHCIV